MLLTEIVVREEEGEKRAYYEDVSLSLGHEEIKIVIIREVSSQMFNEVTVLG